MSVEPMSRPLPESTTLEQVYDLIRAGSVEQFSDIPEQHQFGAVAKEWFNKMYSLNPGRGEAYYAQIPKNCRDDAFMQFARYFVNVLKDTAPHECLDYVKTVRDVILTNYPALNDVHPDFRNPVLDMVHESYPEKLHVVLKGVEWVDEVMSDDRFEKFCSSDLKYALEAPPHLHKKDISQYLDLRFPWIARRCRDYGRLDLLASRFAAGDWITANIFSDIPPKKPSSFNETLDQIKQADSGGIDESVYMAFLMTFPIDQVVAAMTGIRLKKLLIEMYSKEALRPYLSDDNQLKGALLEDAIGL
jgi:hypothetical protein